MELIVRSTVDQTRRTFSQIFLSKNYLRQMQLVNNFHRTNFKYSDLNLVPNKSIEHHWCNILTIDFGKPNSTFHLLSQNCPKANLGTTFINKKNCCYTYFLNVKFSYDDDGDHNHNFIININLFFLSRV